MARTILVLTLMLAVVAGCSDDATKSKGKSVSGTCGNGQIDDGETCDPSLEDGQQGACPTSCSAPACSSATLAGDADACSARCVVEPIACADADGCCPVGCDALSDSDCTNTCGDSVVEGPETCDGDCAADCPSAETCVEGNVLGSADTCSVRCDYVPISICQDGDGCCLAGCSAAEDNDCESPNNVNNVNNASCGNGTIDEGETCDGDCPTSCQSPNSCVVANLVGSPTSCNVSCELAPVSVCQGGDGCCPMVCTSGNDSDCSGTCGNGMLDNGETCDGNCPASCNDNVACTVDTIVGSPTNCNVQCLYNPVTICQNNDGCCPANCASNNDNDCNCVPRTCAQQQIACGGATDGCGQPLDCGGCPSGQACLNGQCNANAGVGASCSSDNDCGGVGGAIPLTCNLMAPGGYCTTLCLPMGGIGCPMGSGCSLLDATLQVSCAKTCQSANDCRPGYDCVPDLLSGTSLCLPGT